jgi:hypothetical protein
MGGIQSAIQRVIPYIAPQPEIITTYALPTMKNGIQDGTSGLHYSGQTYLNQVNQITSTLCDTTTVPYAQVNEVFSNGVANDTLPIDQATQRISPAAITGHVQSLVTSGIAPGQIADINMQIQKDKNFPWPGCSNVIFPLITIASLQFSARSYTNWSIYFGVQDFFIAFIIIA